MHCVEDMSEARYTQRTMNWPSMTNDPAHRLGADGEDMAASYMKHLGFRVIERRFRRRGGEIDLVCVFGTEESALFEEIVFVEVKTRSNRAYGRPEAAVSRKKRIRIIRTAETFLHERGFLGILARFDVIAISRYRGNEHVIDHFVDAFGIHECMQGDLWNEWRS
jgi:putative endonuclease